MYLEEALHQFAFELRVALTCVVVAFDAAAQTVVLQPTIRENVKVNTPDGSGNFIPVSTPTALPLLVDVPVALPRGGGFTLTLPILPGDECVVLFTDSCFNAWWANGVGDGSPGKLQNQEEVRRHDLSDAIAIFGPWSQPRKLTGYSNSKAQLRSDDGTTVVEVGAGEVTLSPDSGVSQIKITPGEIDLTATVVKINGAAYHDHIHSGVTTGGGVTGPVTP